MTNSNQNGAGWQNVNVLAAALLLRINAPDAAGRSATQAQRGVRRPAAGIVPPVGNTGGTYLPEGCNRG
jgi:hypothetical protein